MDLYKKLILLTIFLCISAKGDSQPYQEAFLLQMKKEPPVWMNERIQRDFYPFRNGVNLKKFDEIYHSIDLKKHLIVRFKIMDNQLIAETSIDHTGRSEAVKRALLFLIETTGLPNVDILMTSHDSLNDFPSLALPILTFAKEKNNSYGILIPDCEALNGYNLSCSIEELQAYPWTGKEKKAFWRGTTTGGEYTKENWFKMPRARLTLLSQKMPELIDAKITKIAQCLPGVAEILDHFHLLGEYTSLIEHLKYRYLVDVDGNTCTYPRCYWILLSNSLLLKQDSPNIQWFYDALQPNYHYLPLRQDISDIYQQVEWAKNHDQLAKQIANQATNFAKNDLSQENVYLYFYKVIVEYARLQNLPDKQDHVCR